MKRIILTSPKVREVLETGRVVVRRVVKPQPESETECPYRRCRNTHGDPRFLPCVYLGYSGRKDYPFVVKHEYQDVFSHISPVRASIADALKPPETVITYTIECPECRCLGYVTTIDGLAQRTFCNNCGHELGLFSLKTEGRS